MIVVDTHVLLWWTLDPDKLSRTALTLVAEMEQDGGFASAISIWELGIKIKRGKLELPIAIEELASRIARGGIIQLLPVDTSTWLRSLSLPWEHSDPADRVIVATALMRGARLLTKDAAMHAFPQVSCVW